MSTSVIQYLSFYSFIHGDQLKYATLMPLAAILISDDICVYTWRLLWCSGIYELQNLLASNNKKLITWSNDKIFNLCTFIHQHHISVRSHPHAIPSSNIRHIIVIDGIWAWTVNYVFLNIDVWGISKKKVLSSSIYILEFHKGTRTLTNP